MMTSYDDILDLIDPKWVEVLYTSEREIYIVDWRESVNNFERLNGQVFSYKQNPLESNYLQLPTRSDTYEYLLGYETD